MFSFRASTGKKRNGHLLTKGEINTKHIVENEMTSFHKQDIVQRVLWYHNAVTNSFSCRGTLHLVENTQKSQIRTSKKIPKASGYPKNKMIIKGSFRREHHDLKWSFTQRKKLHICCIFHLRKWESTLKINVNQPFLLFYQRPVSHLNIK